MLVIIARKLRHHALAYTILVRIKYNIKKILHKPDLEGRIKKLV